MNEGMLVDLIGEVDASLLEDDYVEEDLEKYPGFFMSEIFDKQKNFFHHKAMKILAGVTAGSLIATGGIILVIKLHKGNFTLPLIKNKA